MSENLPGMSRHGAGGTTPDECGKGGGQEVKRGATNHAPIAIKPEISAGPSTLSPAKANNMSNEPLTGEVLNQMPAERQASTAIATTQNPFERMALVAMDTGNVDQLDKLLDLQMKWDAAQAAKAFTAAMAAFKADPIVIEKRKLVEFATRDGDTTSYRHATLADVVDAVVAGMGKHGLSHRWDVKQEGGQVAVTCTITHRDGHSESVTMQAAPDSSGKKNAIQQVASAVTYLQRYTLMAAAGVAAADMQEDDGKGYDAQQDDIEYVSDAQLATLTDLADVYIPKGTKRDAFLDYVSKHVGFTVTGLGEIPAKDFDAVHDQIKRIALKKQGGGDAS
jgi:hypothetical protein